MPPGDIFANNYGREHMKPSHQVSYDMRLPHNRKIPVRNDQYIQGTPCWACARHSAYVIIETIVERRKIKRNSFSRNLMWTTANLDKRISM